MVNENGRLMNVPWPDELNDLPLPIYCDSNGSNLWRFEYATSGGLWGQIFEP